MQPRNGPTTTTEIAGCYGLLVGSRPTLSNYENIRGQGNSRDLGGGMGARGRRTNGGEGRRVPPNGRRKGKVILGGGKRALFGAPRWFSG